MGDDVRLLGSQFLRGRRRPGDVTLEGRAKLEALNPPITNNKGRIIDPFSRLSIADIRMAAASALRRSDPSGAPGPKDAHETRATGSS